MEMTLEHAYYQIDLEIATKEGQDKLLQYREGDTIELKKLPRFLEDISCIGTAQTVGTTAVTCLIFNNKVYTANLGDSRAIMGLDTGKKV
jgi:serine/threonine protein phosphatase PrpC